MTNPFDWLIDKMIRWEYRDRIKALDERIERFRKRAVLTSSEVGDEF